MKKQVVWYLPIPSKGSGGFRTITQNARALEEKGFETTFCFPPNPQMPFSENTLRTNLSGWFGYQPRFIEANCVKLDKSYDLAIATQWDTAELVARQSADHKAYFIQDFEPFFYPIGTEYLLASNSYALGLTPITIGNWLQTKCSTPYGHPNLTTPFGADPFIYHPFEQSKEYAICAIYQPEKPRRAFQMLLDSIEIMLALDERLTVYLFGSTQKPQVNNDRINHLGLLTTTECNELYNSCLVGISMGTTNPSRIPFEMMSAGLPVIDLYCENNLYDLPNDVVTLADPSPDALATATLSLINNAEKRERSARKGLKFMQDKTLEEEGKSFANACVQLVNRETSPISGNPVQYPHRAIKSNAECSTAFKDIQEKRLSDLRAEAEPQVIPERNVALELVGEIVQDTEYSVACWSCSDQSDLVWSSLNESEDRRLVGHLDLRKASEEPRPFHFHFYMKKHADEQPAFMFGVNKAVKLCSTIYDATEERQMTATFENEEYRIVLAAERNSNETPCLRPQINIRSRLGLFSRIRHR